MPVSHDKTESYPSVPELAHELRNRLGVIRNAIYCLENLIEPTADTRKYFEILRTQIVLSERVIADLLETDRSRTP